VRKLLAELLATASEMRMRKAVKATVEAVKELQADAGVEGVKVRAIADELKLDMSATYRRVQAAELAGFVVNLEDRPRRPGRYAITGDEPGSMWLLPTNEDLRQRFEAKRQRRVSSPRTPLQHRKKLQSRRLGG
jgi:hypothetical protein